MAARSAVSGGGSMRSRSETCLSLAYARTEQGFCVRQDIETRQMPIEMISMGICI